MYIYILYLFSSHRQFVECPQKNFGRSFSKSSSIAEGRQPGRQAVSTNCSTTLYRLILAVWAIKPINQPAGFICLPYLAVFCASSIPLRLSFLFCLLFLPLPTSLSLFLSAPLSVSVSVCLCNLSSCKQNAHPLSMGFLFFCFVVA